MTALKVITENITVARETFEGTLKDITEETAHKDPGGTALPIAALWIHLLVSEDRLVQHLLQKAPTLEESTFLDKTGASEPMPPFGNKKWGEEHAIWAKRVRISIPVTRQYAAAVYKATDEYVARLSEKDLEKTVTVHGTSQTVGWLLGAYLFGHTYALAGEISALKGTQGMRGYEF
jgi:hypothetical protein